MKQVHYLIGGSGIPNYGDELITTLWIEYLRRLSPGLKNEIVVDVRNIKPCLDIYEQHQNVTFTNVIHKLASLKKEGDVYYHIKRGYNFISNGGLNKYPQLKDFCSLLPRLKTFHIFGGGFINSRWPNAGFYIGFGAALKKTI